MVADNIDAVLLPVVDQEIARVEAIFSEEPSFSAPVQAPQMSSTLVQHQRLSAATPQASSFAQANVEEFSASSRAIVQGHAETLQMERNSMDAVERRVAVSRNSAVEQQRLEVSQGEGNVPGCHVQ
jgi:D-alanyl-D-alanine carboxypeptidase